MCLLGMTFQSHPPSSGPHPIDSCPLTRTFEHFSVYLLNSPQMPELLTHHSPVHLCAVPTTLSHSSAWQPRGPSDPLQTVLARRLWIGLLVAKNPWANARDIRDSGSIPQLGRSPRGGHGNPLQYSCLENPMERGAWWAPKRLCSRGSQRVRHN